MSQLHQIQMQYDPTEDRLVLRIKTQDQVEFRLWLTRRYVKLLWPILMKMMEANEQVSRQADDLAKRQVMSFQHEEAVSKTDFETRYHDDARSAPLGETPVLVSKIQIKQRDQTKVLCMHPANGNGIELAMGETLLHSFSKLLADTVGRTDWDLGLNLGALAAGTQRPERVN